MNTYIARVKNWFWPLVIAVSAVGATLLTTFNVNSPIRVAIAFWFMGFCPGMAFVGALKLKGVLSQITFAIALSLALDMLVSEAIVYAGIWSPDTGIILLAGLSFIGIGLQIIPSALHKAPLTGLELKWRSQVQPAPSTGTPAAEPSGIGPWLILIGVIVVPLLAWLLLHKPKAVTR